MLYSWLKSIVPVSIRAPCLLNWCSSYWTSNQMDQEIECRQGCTEILLQGGWALPSRLSDPRVNQMDCFRCLLSPTGSLLNGNGLRGALLLSNPKSALSPVLDWCQLEPQHWHSAGGNKASNASLCHSNSRIFLLYDDGSEYFKQWLWFHWHVTVILQSILRSKQTQLKTNNQEDEDCRQWHQHP